jgi:hypothetical protein
MIRHEGALKIDFFAIGAFARVDIIVKRVAPQKNLGGEEKNIIST